ncbi:hypothetical protein RFI_23709, partial [Reticulomyxa filosa]
EELYTFLYPWIVQLFADEDTSSSLFHVPLSNQVMLAKRLYATVSSATPALPSQQKGGGQWKNEEPGRLLSWKELHENGWLVSLILRWMVSVAYMFQQPQYLDRLWIHVLYPILSKLSWQYTTTTTATTTATSMHDINSNVSQTTTIATATAAAASVLHAVHNCAWTSLCHMAYAGGYSDLDHLILTNCDYIIDRVAHDLFRFSTYSQGVGADIVSFRTPNILRVIYLFIYFFFCKG